MLVEHRGARPVVDPSAYGVPRGTPPRELVQRQAGWFAAHRDDRVL